MATTTNYGWTTPDNTAYVKDGASAIRSLGSSVDASLYNKIYGITRQLSGNNTFTNQTSFGDFTNAPDKTGLDLSFVKKQNSSLLVVTFNMATFLTSGSTQGFYGAVNIGGTDYALAGGYTAITTTGHMSGVRIISGISAGTYAAKPRFAASTASVFVSPGLTYVSYSIQELPQ